MKRNLITLYIIITLLSVVFAAAAEDFTATTNPFLDVEQCSPFENKLSITNAGDEATYYTLSFGGDAAEWLTGVPDPFLMQPGQIITALSYFSVPCDAKPEDYQLEVYITSAGGLEKFLVQDIAVSKPKNIGLMPVVYSQDVPPCTKAVFSFDLINTGKFEEIYNINIDSFKNETLITENPIALGPNESSSFHVEITPVDCKFHGDHMPVLSVSAENSKQTVEVDLDLSIENAGIVEIAKGVSKIKTGYNASTAEVVILHTGDRDANFTIYTDGASWASISPSSAEIAAGKELKAQLKLEPSEDLEPGNYPLTVVVEFDDSGVSYTKHLIVKLVKPGFVSKLFTKYLIFTIIALIAVAMLIVLLITWIFWRVKNKAKIARKKERKKRLKEIKRQKKKEKKALRKKQKAEKKKLDFQKKKEQRAAKEKKRREEIEARKKELLKVQVRKELSKEYNFIEKKGAKLIVDEKKKRSWAWLWWIILIVVIAALAYGVYHFFDKVKQYVLDYWLYALIGIAVLILLIILLNISRRKTIEKQQKAERAISGREKREAKNKLVGYFEKRYELVPRRKQEKSWGWLKVLIIIIIVAAILAGLAYYFREFVMSYWEYFTAGVIVLIILLILMIKGAGSTKKRFKFIQKEAQESVQVGWRQGLGEALFTTKQKLADIHVTVTQYTKQPVFLKPKWKVLQYFGVEGRNILARDVKEGRFRFKVKKSWLGKNYMDKKDVKLSRYTNKWLTVTTDIVNEDDKFVYYEAACSSFLTYFVITGKPGKKPEPKPEKIPKPVKVAAVKKATKKVRPKPKKVKLKKAKKVKPKKKRRWRWLWYVIIVVILLLAIGFASYHVSQKEPAVTANETPVTQKGIPQQMWPQDNVHTLNLSLYFNDPDGDTLSFASSQPEHIAVDIEGDIVTFTPEPGFVGKETVRFMADDKKGGKVSSNDINLIVTSQSMLAFYANYVVVGIVILIIVILFFESRKKKKELEKGKKKRIRR